MHFDTKNSGEICFLGFGLFAEFVNKDLQKN